MEEKFGTAQIPDLTHTDPSIAAALLKPESNILHFQNRFTKFTMGAQGVAPFSFVFNQSVGSLETLNLDALQEDTSLQRNIKEYYRNGKAIHETSGLILMKRQQ